MPDRIDPGVIRSGQPDEFDRLRAIELEADSVFETVGIGPFENSDQENHLHEAVAVLVIGSPPLGFVCIDLVDGLPHIRQMSVRPSAMGQGRGTALLYAVFEWASTRGYPAVTLTTYRYVPWNAPFYTRLGFRVIEDLSPELSEIRKHEQAIGDDAFGPRVAMRKDL